MPHCKICRPARPTLNEIAYKATLAFVNERKLRVYDEVFFQRKLSFFRESWEFTMKFFFRENLCFLSWLSASILSGRLILTRPAASLLLFYTCELHLWTTFVHEYISYLHCIHWLNHNVLHLREWYVLYLLLTGVLCLTAVLVNRLWWGAKKDN